MARPCADNGSRKIGKMGHNTKVTKITEKVARKLDVEFTRGERSRLHLSYPEEEDCANAHHMDVILRVEICRIKVQPCIPSFDHLRTLGLTKPAWKRRYESTCVDSAAQSCCWGLQR